MSSTRSFGTKYWRSGVRYRNPYRDFWPTMRAQNCLLTGWERIPDLSQYRLTHGGMFNAIQRYYPRVAKDNYAQELLNFMSIGHGDIVVATYGRKAFGIGQIVGNYQYEPSEQYPHRYPVEWREIDQWDIPNRDDGGPFIIAELTYHSNLQEIRRRLAVNN
jgi:5-methylcytosine-specific restriction enzyme B